MAETSSGARQQPHPQPQLQPQPFPYWLSHPPLPPPPSPPHRRTSPFLGALALILFITFIIYIVGHLIFSPLLPKFRVDSLQLVNFSVAAPSLSSLWVVGFSVNNPNKKLEISLDNIESSIYYKDKILSQARIHHFTVPRRNSTAVVTPFVADVSVLNEINGDLTLGAISFTAEVLGHVTFQIGPWPWSGTLIRVFCSYLAVGISSPQSPSGGSGELVGGSRKCQVRDGFRR